MNTRRYATGTTSTESRHAYTALDGVVGGLIGGVLMGMTSMLLFWIRDLGFWYPLRLIATLVRWPDAATERGFEMGPVVVGLIIHMMLSVIFGVGIAAIASRVSWPVVALAILLSLVIWVMMDFLLQPVIADTFDDRFPAWIFGVGHLMYGLGLGGYLSARSDRTTG